MKFNFGEHSEMTKALGETIYMSRCNIVGLALTAYGKTQLEANKHLIEMFSIAVETGYNQYLQSKI